MTIQRASVVALGLLLAGCPLLAAELRGKVELRGRERAVRGVAASEAVVWFTPAGRSAAARPPAAPLEIATERKAFAPRVLVVAPGTRVRFPNRDPILHNVFSVAPGNAFDLGLVGGGEAGETRFEEPGVVPVFCNVHQAMVSHVVVLDTPHWVRPEPDGSFVLSGLPAGGGTLEVWHERADPVRLELPALPSAPVTVGLEVTRPRVPVHTRKDGGRYQDVYR